MRPNSFEQAEEWYVFLRLCEKDFLDAASVLRMIRRYKKAETRLVLLRDGIVSYARPFSENRGRLIQVLRLAGSIVPKSSRPLHKELMDYRNQVFAHTDMEAYNPRLHRWPSKTGYWYPMAFRSLGAHRIQDRLDAILCLVRDIHEAVQREQRGIEAHWLDTAVITSDR